MNTSYKKSNFGIAFFFLNKAQKAALSDVYAFCRTVDDIVDEPADNPQQTLDFWKQEINAVYDGTPSTELGKALCVRVKEFNMNRENFLLLIEGMEMDLNALRYETFEDLQKYLYRVASVVGLMCLEICGVRGKKAQDYALRLGYAVQLTNIIRDVYEDAGIGRVYIPAQTMRKFGVDFNDLKYKNINKVAPMLASLGKQAQALYADAGSVKLSFPRRKLFAARIMGSVYNAILNKIQKNKYIFIKKVKLTKTEKLFAIFKAL